MGIKGLFLCLTLLSCHRSVCSDSPLGKGLSETNTPLMAAIIKEDREALTSLLNSGCDMEVKNKYKKTALYFAVSRMKVDVVKELLKRGAKTDTSVLDQGITVLMQACHGCWSTYFDEKEDIDFAELEKKNIAIIALLLDYGANVSYSSDSKTALDYAKARKNPLIINMLSEKK